MTALPAHLARLALVVALTGCAANGGAPGDLKPAHLERLYFGRNIGDTATVTDSAWARFVREELTPAFPEGTTIFNASGQWRAPDGTIVREGTFVVELLHADAPEVERRLQHLIDAYKRRFAQQSVLRIMTNVRATFR